MYSWQGLLDFENESCRVPLSHLGRAQVLLLLTWKYLSPGDTRLPFSLGRRCLLPPVHGQGSIVWRDGSPGSLWMIVPWVEDPVQVWGQPRALGIPTG